MGFYKCFFDRGNGMFKVLDMFWKLGVNNEF